MCKLDPNQLETLVRQAIAAPGMVPPSAAAPAAEALADGASPRGSRRRRLWELDGHAHCPVVGVCLPIAALRRLVDKSVGGKAVAGDYELHCGAVADCKLRTPLAEAVQRELDRRYMAALRQSAQAKTTEALAAWWDASRRGHDIGGALWATLSHPRCTATLEHRVLGEVHMLQHQAGMAVRVDLERFEALIDENAVVSRELANAQQRCSRLQAEHDRRTQVQQTQILQLRAQLITRDSALAAARDDLATLEAAVPGLKSRHALAREVERHVERIHELERTLLQARQEAERLRRRSEEAEAELRQRPAVPDDPQAGTEAAPERPAATLNDRAVLCVGGRAASVPLYRRLIEHTGGRFLHHDGGAEEGAAKLDATLAAADLVICQTGCISHDAYWRVKDHCKRTGKRCVFVENPSSSGLRRALDALAPPTAAQEAAPTT